MHISTALSGSMYDLSHVDMFNVKTTNSKATNGDGGTLYLNNGHLAMRTCVDVGASALNGRGGFGFIQGSGSHSIQSTNFQQSEALHGGFLAAELTSIQLTALVVNNPVAKFGGALHLVSSDVFHSACTFTNVLSQIEGGIWLASSSLHWPSVDNGGGFEVSTFSDAVAPGKYLSEGAAREWSTVVLISIPPPSFNTCFIVFVTFFSILKHPNKSFLTLYVFGHFYHTVYYYIFININLFHFNVKFFEVLHRCT